MLTYRTIIPKRQIGIKLVINRLIANSIGFEMKRFSAETVCFHLVSIKRMNYFDLCGYFDGNVMLNCLAAAVGIVKSSSKHKTLLFGNPSPKRYYAKELNLCQAVCLNEGV